MGFRAFPARMGGIDFAYLLGANKAIYATR
jgi:hypothetical protein